MSIEIEFAKNGVILNESSGKWVTQYSDMKGTEIVLRTIWLQDKEWNLVLRPKNES